VLLHPGKILVDLPRVDDEEVPELPDAIDNQVVDDPTGFIEQKGVLALADSEPVHIVGQHVIQPRRRGRSFSHELTHVRDVEDAELPAHRVVLLDNARILDRHGPTAEIDHLRTETDVFGVKRSLFESG